MEIVTVYTKNNCRQCVMTKKLMSQQGVKYKEVFVDIENGDPIADQLRSEGFMAMPVVKPNAGAPWTGFQPDKIKAL